MSLRTYKYEFLEFAVGDSYLQVYQFISIVLCECVCVSSIKPKLCQKANTFQMTYKRPSPSYQISNKCRYGINGKAITYLASLIFRSASSTSGMARHTLISTGGDICELWHKTTIRGTIPFRLHLFCGSGTFLILEVIRDQSCAISPMTLNPKPDEPEAFLHGHVTYNALTANGKKEEAIRKSYLKQLGIW